MAVRLTSSGLQSYDPSQASKAYTKKTFSGGGTSGSGGTTSQSISRGRKTTRGTTVKPQKKVIETQEVERREQIRKEAEAQKQRELFAIREQRIEELQKENRESGILSSRGSSRRIILAREHSEIKQAGKTTVVKGGATGEVQAVEDRGFIEETKSKITRGTTVKPQKKVIETQEVEGGKLESRIISMGGGVPTTQIIFIPKGGGSERIATGEESVSFREKQIRETEIRRPEDVLGGVQYDVETQRKIIETKNLRGEREAGFKDIGEQVFIGGIGAGAASSLIGTVKFGKDIVTAPIKTAKATGESLKQLSFDLESGKILKDISTTIKTSPGYAFGYAATEISTDVFGGQVLDDVSKFGGKVKARISPGYSGVVLDPETGIKSIPDVEGIGTIELIPPKGDFPIQTLSKDVIKDIPSDVTSRAGFKGPYGYSPEYIKSLSGKTGPVLTSAKDLFGSAAPGKTDLLGKKIKITPLGEYGDISLFGTPFEPSDISPRTRISRLGAETPSASFTDLLKGDVSFGGKTKSQIVVFPEEKIGGTFKPVQFTPGELEVVTKGDKIITKTGQPGVTIIDGKPVQIITAKFEKLPVDTIDNTNIKKYKGFSSEEIKSYSSSSPVVTSSTFSPLISTVPYSASSTYITSKVSSPSISTSVSSPSISTSVSSPSISTSVSSPSISTSVSSPVVSSDVSISPTVSSISSPKISKSISRIISPPTVSYPPTSPISLVPTSKIIYPKFKQPTIPKLSGRLFGVQVRRAGKFFSVGKFRTQQEAFERGRKITSRSLAATFKLTGPTKSITPPKGFRTKKTILGTLFIEKKEKRLSKKTEIGEIQLARRLK